MGLRGIFRDELPEIFGDFEDDEAPAEDAVYTPVGGDPVNCKVFLEIGSSEMPLGLSAQIVGSEVTIEALLSNNENIGIGTELPQRGAMFEIEGTVYTVNRVLNTDGLTATMSVT